MARVREASEAETAHTLPIRRAEEWVLKLGPGIIHIPHCGFWTFPTGVHQLMSDAPTSISEIHFICLMTEVKAQTWITNTHSHQILDAS